MHCPSTIATSEIVIGDNDTLGAIVATAIGAELLIILTDIDGLYTSDPRRDPDAKLITEVTEISEDLLAGAGGGGSQLSTGGMATKLAAAEICMRNNTDMMIVNSAQPAILYDVLEGKAVGTHFIGRKAI